MKAAFGGRIRLLISASAPIENKIKDFMCIVNGVPMLEAYG